jgi:hypothetical protein
MNRAVLAAVALVVGIGAAAKSQAPEIQRYLKVKKM